MGAELMTGNTDRANPVTVCNTWISQLLQGFAVIEPDYDRLVGALELNSQRVERGDVFVALPGITVDGRHYIEHAIANRASAIIFEKSGSHREDQVVGGIPLIGVENLKSKLGIIAARLYSNPSRALNVIGVTGTNGKTTIAFMIAQALDACGQKCGYSGTVGSGFIGNLEKSEFTTADAISVQHQLAGFVADSARALAMEVSSHGLDQGRANGVEFKTGVFTNLTQDHLDYHQSMEKYAAAKQKLFEFASLENAVINVDDEFGSTLEKLCRLPERNIKCFTYGINSGELRPENLEISDQGFSFDLTLQGKVVKIESDFLGEVNVYNLLATIAVLDSAGVSADKIVSVIPLIGPPPGRMEVFGNVAHQPAVVVDFAHTPDALERTLVSLRKLCRGKLVVVFGCGGDRDKGKRPQMGLIAETLGDQVFITDDNPRTECPAQIIEDIRAGMSGPATVVHDRREAVRQAIALCSGDDMVLVAGKGHEDTQSIMGQDFALSDRIFVPQLLESEK
jgi:UDP-N-acetylmuramyl-tripeptide synthetase